MRDIRKIITCRALAPVLESCLKTDEPLTILDIALHLQPDRLRSTLNDTIQSVEQEGATVLLGYGLCGRALEGVCSRKSTLVLPRVDDCVGALLGSRDRHRRFLLEHPGSYFMEPRWLDTELNIFTQINKGLDRIPPQRRKQLLRTALKHYERLVMLSGKTRDREAEDRCAELARDHDLLFQAADQDLELMQKLVQGHWNEREFIVVPPGTPISMF